MKDTFLIRLGLVKVAFSQKNVTFIFIIQFPARLFARVENLNLPYLSSKEKFMLNLDSLTLQKI